MNPPPPNPPVKPDIKMFDLKPIYFPATGQWAHAQVSEGLVVDPLIPIKLICQYFLKSNGKPISERTARDWIKQGKIPARKTAVGYRARVSAILALVN